MYEIFYTNDENFDKMIKILFIFIYKNFIQIFFKLWEFYEN